MKVGVVDADVRISSHLKYKLSWAADKQIQVISVVMIFKKTVVELRS